MRELHTIVIHHSDTDWGQVSDIRQWHRDRGFNDIGYHYVVLNQYPTYNALRYNQPSLQTDGLVQEGRPLDQVGAHARGFNSGSIGICLIGKEAFTPTQMKSLRDFIQGLILKYPTITRICGHRDLLPTLCPTFNAEKWWLSGCDEVTV
jgi:N-acetyl-anhydromuramyl-L-alanine amidase AmpD